MRKTFRVRDMVLSLLVMAGVVAVMYFAVPRDESSDGPPAISYASSVDSARRAAPYSLLAPDATPKGWRATSVKYDANEEHYAPTWHLGFLTPDKQYAAVEQGRGAGFVADRTQDARRAGTQRVAGEEWTRYTGGDHRYRGLVRKGPKGTTAVVGTAPFTDLAKLAAALKG